MQRTPAQDPCLEVLKDQYVLEKREMLGKGSIASVYRGYLKKDPNQFVAIKIVTFNNFNSQKKSVIAKCMENEQKNQAQLNCVNLVKFYEYFESYNKSYIILEYCDEKDLSWQLQTSQNGRFDQQQALCYTKQIINGYKQMYNKNIVHRDLKPQNILFSGGNAKIADFGFSRILEYMENPSNFTLVGTPLYCAPEILKGEYYEANCDIWSLGCILYEMLYGTLPYIANTRPELIKLHKEKELKFPKNIEVEVNLIIILKKMLQVDPSKRIRWPELFLDKIFQSNQIISDINQFQNKEQKSHILQNFRNVNETMNAAKKINSVIQNYSDIRDFIKQQVLFVSKYKKYLNKLITSLFVNSLFKYLVFNNQEFQQVIEGKDNIFDQKEWELYQQSSYFYNNKIKYLKKKQESENYSKTIKESCLQYLKLNSSQNHDIYIKYLTIDQPTKENEFYKHYNYFLNQFQTHLLDRYRSNNELKNDPNFLILPIYIKYLKHPICFINLGELQQQPLNPNKLMEQFQAMSLQELQQEALQSQM